jgi:mannose-6-phosphate isomerase-like protein (cupin superfamily)
MKTVDLPRSPRPFASCWAGLLFVGVAACAGGQASRRGSTGAQALAPRVFALREAQRVEKYGIRLAVYPVSETTAHQAGFVTVDTEYGHHQEFLDVQSTFMYYVLDGEGVFVIDGRSYPVGRTDVIAIPPNHRFFYAGRLRMALVTAPAWRPENERSIRLVSRQELQSILARARAAQPQAPAPSGP